jgi:K+-transporting ATPase ATPase C chain
MDRVSVSVAELRGGSAAAIPGDAATASASGLDPEISPAYAELQVERVAKARGASPVKVRDLVARHTAGPAAGIVGEARVNVLDLNLALDAELKPGAG